MVAEFGIIPSCTDLVLCSSVFRWRSLPTIQHQNTRGLCMWQVLHTSITRLWHRTCSWTSTGILRCIS